MRRWKYIFLTILLMLSCADIAAQSRLNGDGMDRRTNALGGGGSNYSRRRPDRHGLLTHQYSEIHHLFGFSLNAAYSGMQNGVLENSFLPGGINGGFNVLYDYQRYYFKMQVGAGIQAQSVTNGLADYRLFDESVSDALGYKYTLMYEFDDREDISNNVYLDIPIMLGAGFSDMYFLAGLKYRLPILGSTQVNATVSTSAFYEQYLGHFVEMDNHGMRKNVQVSYMGDALRLKSDVMLAAEFGYEKVKGRDYEAGFDGASRPYQFRFRVAAFAEYGLLNQMPNTNNLLTIIPPDYKWDFPEFQMNHVFSTSEAHGHTMHNFFVGLRFTILFGALPDEHCILCGPFGSEADY